MYTPEQFKNQWNQFKGLILENFDELTADDIAAINGKREVLISKIQSRYGVSKDEAEEQLSEIEESVVTPGVTGRTTSTPVKGTTTKVQSRDVGATPGSKNPQVRGNKPSTGTSKDASTLRKGNQGFQK